MPIDENPIPNFSPLDDAIQLDVPEEEDLTTFPPDPPSPPIKETKFAFRDKIKFIIPKLNKNHPDYKGKTCLKHHSILCRVCPLIIRAKRLTTHRQLISNHVDDLKIVDDDPDNYKNDPSSREGDPFCDTASSTNNHVDDLVIADGNPSIRTGDPQVFHDDKSLLKA